MNTSLHFFVVVMKIIVNFVDEIGTSLFCCLNLGLLYKKNKIYKLKIQYILFLYIHIYINIQNENMKKEQSRLKNIRHVQQII